MARLDLTPTDVVKLLDAETDFIGYQIVVMAAICSAESGRNAYANNVNHSTADPLPVTHRSLDAGLWQLNSYWLPKVLAAENQPVPTLDTVFGLVYDPVQNAKWAAVWWAHAFKTTAGTYSQKLIGAYSAWASYAAGTHKPFMKASYDAAVAAGVDLNVG